MRVAVLSELWLPFPGGAERYMFNISRELKRRGHEIQVLTQYANAATFDGIRPRWATIGCHLHDAVPGHTHAEGWRVINDFLGASRAELVLTHSHFAREFADELFGGLRPVVQVVHNEGRHPAAALAVYNSRYTRDRAGPRGNDLVILPPAFDDVMAAEHGDFIGFIKPIPHKGSDFFYTLAERLPEKKFMVLCGEWSVFDDVRRGRDNVFFMPPVHEMPTFYEKCRMVLVPSLQEDAGTVPAEAALNGIPCVSSDVMGLPETNAGGVVLPLDLDCWVKEIYSLDNELRYSEVVGRQRAYVQGLAWPSQFDKLAAALAPCLPAPVGGSFRQLQ